MSWEGRNETGCTAQDQTEQNRIVVAVVQSLSRVQLLITPWTTVHQASLSFIISLSLLKLLSIESLMPSHLILCHPLLLLPSVSPSIRVFSKEVALCIRWPENWSFSFKISFLEDKHMFYSQSYRKSTMNIIGRTDVKNEAQMDMNLS